MTRCAIYTRVSTDEQAETGHSLEAQMAACEALAAARGWEIAGRYIDAGFSGGKSDRPEWQRMQADARAHRFDVVVVHKLDRFSRDVSAGLGVIDELRNLGVSFVSVAEQFDFTTPMGGMFLTMLLAFAQLYRENLRAEVHKGKLQRARKGMTNGNAPPFGYRRVEGRDVVVPAEAALWREAMERVVAGATDLDIVRWLNDLGAVMPSGRAFTRVAVREMIVNPFYIGRVRWRGLRAEKNTRGDRKRRLRREAETFPGLHEPIIDLELWTSAQRVRRARGTGGGGIRKRAYLLRGIARCAECGGRLTCEPKAAGRSPRYVCRAYERNATCSCDRRSVAESVLAAQVDGLIERLNVDDELLQVPDLAGQDGPRAAGERRAAEILAEQKRLDVLFQRGRIDQARWESEVARLDVELASLAPAAEPATSVEIRTLLDTWHEIADGLEDKREILSVLLTSVDVDLSTGRIVAWHARPEYAAAIALATREK